VALYQAGCRYAKALHPSKTRAIRPGLLYLGRALRRLRSCRRACAIFRYQRFLLCLYAAIQPSIFRWQQGGVTVNVVVGVVDLDFRGRNQVFDKKILIK